MLVLPVVMAPLESRLAWFLFTHAMGVPRPLRAAMMADGAGVGAVRTSRWEKGVQFKEVVTQWQPPYRMFYDFDIPP